MICAGTDIYGGAVVPFEQFMFTLASQLVCHSGSCPTICLSAC
jgi:hypothetical protein